MAASPPKPFHSLGFYAIAWIENFLVHGPGDVQGKPIELDDEFAAFTLKAYEVDGRGARKVRRAFLSRAKGRNKSGFAAMMQCFEALGECRFDHWAQHGEMSDWGYEFEPGEPVGRPLTYVEILNVATEEGQAGNTYDAVYYMLHPDTCSPELLDRFGRIDVGLTRTFLPNSRGFIEPVTASNDSKDGGKSTFIVADEALALDTPLPTPTGWTTMGLVQVDDELIGSDGLPVRVLKATEVQHGRRCYRVSFTDGTSMVASDGHLWQTRWSSNRHSPRVRTTGEMVAAMSVMATKGQKRKFRVPVGRSWKLPSVDLPVDPYLVGYWLGDGTTGVPHLTVGWEDLETVEEILAGRGIETHRLRTTEDRPPLLSFARRAGHYHTTPLGHACRTLSCWQSKHIPALYLRGSIEQRIDLLRGLMDSDGCATGSACVFIGNERMSADVLELLRSLGQVATRAWVKNARSRVGGYWRVGFTPRGGLIPFTLPRKVQRVRQHSHGPDWVTVTSIDPVPSVPVRCVAVDASDHLFAAGRGGHITHNSHLWVPPATGVFKLGRMHQTMVRNLLKRKEASGWMLETSTMYAEGEGSVAEGTHAYATESDSGKLLFDHRQASEHWDLSKRSERVKALKEAYGPAAAWMDLGAIADYWDDPQASEAEFRRFWLNQPTPLSGPAVFDLRAWASAPVLDRQAEPPTRAVLVVSATLDRRKACIGVAGDCGGKTVVLCHSLPIGEVAAKVVELTRSQDIAEVALAGAPPKGLAPELTRLGVEFVTLSNTEMGAAAAAFIEGVRDATVMQVGQSELDAAVANARTRMVGESEQWDRRDAKVDDSPLVACSGAFYRWGLLKPDPMPQIHEWPDEEEIAQWAMSD